jgi:hypothetical protein
MSNFPSTRLRRAYGGQAWIGAALAVGVMGRRRFAKRLRVIG